MNAHSLPYFSGFWLAALFIANGSEGAPRGDWPMWKHDAQLAAYQPLHADGFVYVLGK